MAELDEAIEAAARHAWAWTRAEEHADGCTGRPEWDQASDGHREGWLATAAMYVTPAAEVIVAATRRQVADRADRLAAALADIAQTAREINDLNLTPSTRAERALAVQADALRALREDRAAIARGRGETQPPPTH